MKKQNMFSGIAFVILLAAGSLFAQMNNNPIKANVPFDFTAGSATLPAGEYRVAAMSDLGTLSVVGRGSAMSLVGSRPVQAGAESGSTKLIFHRYGNRYFLYQIWVEGENRGRELPQTRLEKEIASNARSSSVAILAQK
jgi:hypothetical protein